MDRLAATSSCELNLPAGLNLGASWHNGFTSMKCTISSNLSCVPSTPFFPRRDMPVPAILLVHSNPGRPARKFFDRDFAIPGVRSDLAQIGIRSPENFSSSAAWVPTHCFLLSLETGPRTRTFFLCGHAPASAKVPGWLENMTSARASNSRSFRLVFNRSCCNKFNLYSQNTGA